MRILRRGSVGPGVQLLQLALNRAGYGELQTDGIFGPLTERAVRAFQAAQNIQVDGIAGRDTHRQLLPWYTGSLPYRIRKGDTFYTLAERYGPIPRRSRRTCRSARPLPSRCPSRWCRRTSTTARRS